MLCCWETAFRVGYGRIRMMSAYPKHFIDPVCIKSHQRTSNFINGHSKMIYLPTKASKNDESSSIFYDEIAKKMINYLTKGGNKKLARTLFENTSEIIKRRQLERVSLDKDQGCIADPYDVLIRAIENCRPLMQLTAIKRGGVNYMVPVPITEKRSYFLAMKWILDAAREKQGSTHLAEKLSREILDAADGQGKVVKRKNDLHKQCESNRAYAHYRWS